MTQSVGGRKAGRGAVVQSSCNAGPYDRLAITPPPRQTSPS